MLGYKLMDATKLVLQIISTLVSAGLLIAALYGLGQLKQAKKALKTQSLRDTRKITAEYTYLYLDRILNARKQPSVSKDLSDLLKNFRFSNSDEDGLDHEEILKNDPETKLTSKKEVKKYTEDLDKALSFYTPYLNELESFCSAVTSGILDEGVLYKALGQDFVNYLESQSLVQAIFYISEYKNLCVNVAEVYKLWRLRTSITQLEDVERASISTAAEIEELKKKLKATERHTIGRIGVDD